MFTPLHFPKGEKKSTGTLTHICENIYFTASSILSIGNTLGPVCVNVYSALFFQLKVLGLGSILPLCGAQTGSHFVSWLEHGAQITGVSIN